MVFKIKLKNSETVAKWRQFLAAVCLGPLSFGISIGWTSPVLPQLQDNNGTLPLNLTVEEGSWVGSMLAIGVLIAAVPAGFLGDRFGPRKCLLCLVIPIVIFTVMVALAKDVYVLSTGRLIAGIAVGAFSALSPPYLGESSHPSRRGVIASFFEFLIYGGVLLVSTLGAFVDYVILTVIFCVISIIVAMGLWYLPESAVYLLSRNKRDDAVKALQFYRSDTFNMAEAIDNMEESLAVQNQLNLRKTLTSKAVRRGLVACFGLTSFQQLTGVDAVTFYNVQIWQAAETDFDPYILAIVLNLVQFFSHITIILVAEKASRRFLMSCSAIVCGLTMFAVALFFHFKQYGYYFPGMDYIPVVSMSLFLVGYSFGLGPIPWMISGELFPPNVKYIAGGLITSVHWLILFITSKMFPVVMDDMGAQYPFYFFGFCMVLCLIFIKFWVPETRGKTLEQIQNELGQ